MVRDGDRLRFERYYVLDRQDDPSRHIDLPATAAQVLAWTATQTPVDVSMYDGKNTYNKTGPYPPSFTDVKPPYVHVLRGSIVNDTSFPHANQWETSDRGFEPLAAADSADPRSVPTGCVGVWQTVGADQRREYWLDPAHDHICVRETWFRKFNGNSVAERVKTLSDFDKLPGGQWYARTATTGGTVIPEKPTEPLEEPYTQAYRVDISPLEPADIPAKLFDGNELTKGVKVITY
jgi:hypothetical protein